MIVTLAAAVAVAATLSRDANPPPRAVDLHCHVAGIGAGDSGCFVSDTMRRSFKMGAYLKAFGVTEDDLRRYGDWVVVRRLAEKVRPAADLDAAVVLALDAVWDRSGAMDRARTELYVPNEFVRAAIAPFPWLLYGCSVHPRRPDALARLDAEAAAGARLVKWLPNIMDLDCADPSLVPFYRKLRALRLPLLVHTGTEHSFTRTDDTLGDPAKLELALREGVTVIAAHCAGEGKTNGERNLDRLVVLMARWPNLYADVSAVTLINHAGNLERLLATPGVADRLVYGSDYPLTETVLTSPWTAVFRIGFRRAWRIAGIRNPWDRDIAFKRALGLPDAVLARGASLLRLLPSSGR